MWQRVALLVLLAGIAHAGKPELWLGGKRIAIREAHISAVSNDNQRFTVWLKMPKLPSDEWGELRFAGEALKITGTGSDDSGSDVSLEVDRAHALALAKGYGVKARERTRLDQGMRYTWTFPTKATVMDGDPITIKLRVENAGKTTVGFTLGGRQRGPRDNRFSFVVTRNGKPVKAIDAPDFGGLMQYKKLAPGERLEVSADLRDWARIDQPGYYGVTARYEGELAKDGGVQSGPDEQADVWDVAPSDEAGILVP